MIPRDLQEMLEPLERFDDVRRGVIRLGDRLCDLAYANPYEGVQEETKDAIRAALEQDRVLGLQYTPFGGGTLPRRAVADALRKSHRLDFGFEDVILSPGAMAALHLALRASARTDGEVIIPTPCWIDHPLYVRATGLIPVPVPLSGPSFDLDVDALSSAINGSTCAVLLAHPANPTGRLYDPDTLRNLGWAVSRMADRFGSEITIIADETHRDFTDDGSFRSIAEVADRVLIVYSFGKYHFIQGQRIGYVAVSPRHPSRVEASQEIVRWTRILGFATPTALMQRAVPTLLGLRYQLDWVAAWRGRYVAELSASGYDVVHPEATLFIYVRTPRGKEDFAFVEELASASVLCLPAPIFHHQGYFRISLTGSEAMLERALPILRSIGGS
jgi:aspartate aminotransferase